MSINITINAETALEAREQMFALVYGVQANQVAEPQTTGCAVGGVIPIDEPKTDTPAESNVTPIKRIRKLAAKAEDRAPEGVMSPDPLANKHEPGMTKEKFVDTLKELRAKFGEAIIPEIRQILSKHKTADGDEVVRGSDVQVSDMPAVAEKFAALEAKWDAAKADVI